jgi:hypothetical protein
MEIDMSAKNVKAGVLKIFGGIALALFGTLIYYWSLGLKIEYLPIISPFTLPYQCLPLAGFGILAMFLGWISFLMFIGGLNEFINVERYFMVLLFLGGVGGMTVLLFIPIHLGVG